MVLENCTLKQLSNGCNVNNEVSKLSSDNLLSSPQKSNDVC